MLWPYRNVTGTKMLQKVLSRCMSGIYCMSSYERFMHGIYQIYTWYILFMNSIYQVYAWYMFKTVMFTWNMFTWNLSFVNDVIYLVYTWFTSLIHMVYIRFLDFVGSITVAPTPSHRIIQTTFFRTQTTWQISNCQISKHWLMHSLMGCARKVIMSSAACLIRWPDCQIRELYMSYTRFRIRIY